MDVFEIDGEMLSLPLFGRSMCIEALSLALEFIQETPETNLSDTLSDFIPDFMEAAQEVEAKGLLSDFQQPFDLTQYSLSSAIDGSLLDPLQDTSPSTQTTIENLVNVPEEQQHLMSATLIVTIVHQLHELESEFIKGNFGDYSSFMKVADPLLSQLIKFHNMLRGASIDLQLASSKMGRQIGAHRGGAAKAGRMSELKEVVITEAIAKYPNSAATKAAQEIFKKLQAAGQYLTDEKGKDLLKDPATTFTRWIRDHRKAHRAKK